MTLADGREIEGDFFVDCSGFRKLIIGGAYEEEWISYAEHLPVNRALPFSVPHEEGASIPSYTHAWALSAGWLWQIPTQERLGCGYAYCDDFISRDEAQAEVEAALGHAIEPWGDIPIASGRFRRLWVKNCVAVGLSGAFSEPLESTSIHGTLVQLLVLVQEYLTDHFDFDAEPILDRYNRRMGRMYDDFRDFLVMHYQGGRDDTEFLAIDRHQRLGARAPRPVEAQDADQLGPRPLLRGDRHEALVLHARRPRAARPGGREAGAGLLRPLGRREAGTPRAAHKGATPSCATPSRTRATWSRRPRLPRRPRSRSRQRARASSGSAAPSAAAAPAAASLAAGAGVHGRSAFRAVAA